MEALKYAYDSMRCLYTHVLKGKTVTLIVGAGALTVVGIVIASELSRVREAPLSEDQKHFYGSGGSSAASSSEKGSESGAVAHRVTAAQIPEATTIMAAANKRHPLMIACSKESFTDDGREGALKWLYSVLLRATVPSGSKAIVLKVGRGAPAPGVSEAAARGVAIWYPDGATINMNDVFFEGGWRYLYHFSDWNRRGRFGAYSTEIVTAFKNRLTKADASPGNQYYYLMTYGVEGGEVDNPEPEQLERMEAALKGLVDPVTATADAKKLPCYVEVSSERDVELFKKFDFEKVDETKWCSVMIYFLKRAPNPPKRATASP